MLLLFQVSAESLSVPAMNSHARSIKLFLEKIYSTRKAVVLFRSLGYLPLVGRSRSNEIVKGLR